MLGALLAAGHPARAQQPSPTPAPSPSPADVNARTEAILAQMSTQQKIDYIGGTPFFDIKPMPQFGLPEIFMTDGPMGVRLMPSTRYPAELELAATWNVRLAQQMGEGMGRDSRARGYYVILAPGMDFYRYPIAGRNAEYLSGEDPYLGSQMAPAFIQGVQSQGVWACAKHYAANDQEFKRSSVDIEVDERTLREIYLPPFEASVKTGKVASVMGAYNQVNGNFACESFFLDTQVLKQEWGFPGPLISDYNAIHTGTKAFSAGCDLDLPSSSFFNQSTLGPGLADGTLSTDLLNDKVRRLLHEVIGFGFLDRPQQDTSIPLDDPTSNQTALKIAREGMVLLRNQNNLLPLD